EAPEVGKAKAEFVQALALAEIRTKTLESLRAAGDSVPARQVQEAESAQREARVRLLVARQALVNLGLPVRVEDFKGLAVEEVARRVQVLGLPDDVVKGLDPDVTTANLLPVRSPLDGVVVAREVVLGEGAEAFKTLFVVADTRRMWLTLRVPLKDV